MKASEANARLKAIAKTEGTKADIDRALEEARNVAMLALPDSVRVQLIQTVAQLTER